MADTTITVKLPSGKKLDLSVEDAKSAHSQLNALFGISLVPAYPNVIPCDFQGLQFDWPPGTVICATSPT